MSVSLEGFNTGVVTFYGEDVNVNDIVKVTDSASVEVCKDGDEFCGICINKNEDTVGIIIGGYVETKYSGTEPSFGYETVVADGEGGIKKAASGKKVLVVNLDPATKKIAMII